MKKLRICIFLMIIIVGKPCFAQNKQESIRMLMEVITPTSMADMIYPIFLQMGINAPRTFYINFFSNSNIMNEYYDIIIPLYDKYYTHDEINDILAFYQTPTGRKLLETMSPMMAEAMPLMMGWSERITPLLLDELRRSGYSSGW